MIMLISFVGTLTRTTIGVGGQYFFMAKCQVLISVFLSIIISGGSASYFIEIVMLISFLIYPNSNNWGYVG